MSNPLETRIYELLDMEFRAEGEQRIVRALTVPYDTPTQIGSRFVENFPYASRPFAKNAAERGDKVGVFMRHDFDHTSVPVGRTISLTEDSRGLVSEFRLSATERGFEAWELVKDGTLHSVSASFVPLRNREDRTADGKLLVHRTEARLDHIALETSPAYSDARVLAMRSDADLAVTGRSLEMARRQLEALRR